MNAPTKPSVLAPIAPRTMAETGLGMVMMRDILLKTMFRMNLDLVTLIARQICLPVNVTQDLVDLARGQKLIEATGTLHATSGNEMGYQLTDAGRARALDALSQSEYYGAMPVPLDVYKDQVRRQSISDITSPFRPSGWFEIFPNTRIRFSCAPAARLAAISLAGRPSLVTAPLKSFTATGSACQCA